MLSVATNTTVVGRLRIRSKSPDPQAEQRRIGQMLRLATLHPAGLPESAMLVVRRLPDPLPSRLRVGPFDLLPDASWQRAVAAALEKLATSAAQPAYGAVPPTSDAVLFYDRAELLASLALDWMSGTLLLHWWWRELLRGSDVVTTLLRKWKESPQYVPGALDLLAKHSRAVQFVQRLPEQAVSEILEAVLRVYGVPRPRAKDTAPQKNSEDREEPPEWTASATKTQARQHVMMLQAPWLFWVPEACTPGLLPIQKMLLIQAMMLRRAPATARTVAFQKDLLRWEAGAQREAESGRREAEKTQMKMPSWASRHKPPAPQIPEQVAVAKQLAGVPAQAAASLFYGAVHEHLAANAVSVERQAQTGSEDRSKSARRRVVYAQEAAVGINGEPAGALRQVQPQSSNEQEVILTQEPMSAPVTQREEAPQPGQAAQRSTLDTEYGGVFFLLNLALYLNIYADFTSPEGENLELSIWDFLALLGSEFTHGEIEADPLWKLLATLACRTDSQRPGEFFHPPSDWRLPSEWLRPFPEDYDQQPVLRNGRLISIHTAGFPVLDVACDHIQEDEPIDPLQRWLGWMAAYIRARLARALGREDAATMLCRLPARVACTLTHLDVTFSLDHHPIEVRLPGLDRDPGWIPASGRYVAFHFD